MSVPRTAAAKINWAKFNSALQLKKETSTALLAFRKRFEETQRVYNQLKEQKPEVDFAHYRQILKNKAVVDQMESTVKAFKPVAYDVQGQLKVIEAFEAKAVEKAQQTADQVENNIVDLREALKNIEASRPVQELTVDDLSQAFPEFDKEMEEAVKKGEWHTPGYDEKFGSLSVL
ncbi:ATP synthase d subunit [Dimargaris verticillata]|uniref:ATP synthase subunit d, mitochondrial n=1 Tax=Dimargaris verticillata TaxID=2761393 RepID=A0A9W8B5M9_9FUNG|nr:ATP synthase d subunit [Dimargaris verticillata]